MSRARCDKCEKIRSGITGQVIDGRLRFLCPACSPPLPPSATAGRTTDPTHKDPLFKQ